ncbi:VWA domain-containing protein [Pigmentibacter ruber]|uniref:VWA domain-containing protein n=1 Tax=Pigmentibacter ruber TaxID=2683196 RepID=UPI00131B1E11|nr:VWA domain-containing protein [Pigmentibacter ruber]BFD33294.1 hypothetical protein GTC16762_29120 [Pigmentibacter ruber]
MEKKDLGQRNYVLVIDRSGSMSDSVSSKILASKWDYVKESVSALAKKCYELDKNGIDIYLFNRSFQKFLNITPDNINSIFSDYAPMGGTDFIPVLTEVFNQHFVHSELPTSIIVITDGEPSEGIQGQKALANLIVNVSKKLESDNELGVSFIQVGNDKQATEFLKKLDDDLLSVGAKYDICDTKTFDDLENLPLEKILLDIVND